MVSNPGELVSRGVSKGSSWTLTKQKSWSASAGLTLRFPPSRTTAHLWNLSLNSNTLKSLLLVMESCSPLLRRWRKTAGLPLLPELTELQQGYQNRKCYATAFPGLCLGSWSIRLSSMGHFFSDIWFLKNHLHTCPSPDVYGVASFLSMMRMMSLGVALWVLLQALGGSG